MNKRGLPTWTCIWSAALVEIEEGEGRHRANAVIIPILPADKCRKRKEGMKEDAMLLP